MHRLGSGKSVALSVHEVLAIEQLLGINVVNMSGVMHERFIFGHVIYSSLRYVRSKRHSNHSIFFGHPNFSHGIILGILEVKPLCQCTVSISQHCQCALYNVVLVRPVVPARRSTFQDRDFGVTSDFLVEVKPTDHVVAIFPSQIKQKCIYIVSGNSAYFYKLPYRIYGD